MCVGACIIFLPKRKMMRVTTYTNMQMFKCERKHQYEYRIHFKGYTRVIKLKSLIMAQIERWRHA